MSVPNKSKLLRDLHVETSKVWTLLQTMDYRNHDNAIFALGGAMRRLASIQMQTISAIDARLKELERSDDGSQADRDAANEISTDWIIDELPDVLK